MTLFISLLTVMMSVLGAHSQRTLADIDYELQREVEITEQELTHYYTQYAKDYQKFKNELKRVNIIKLKFYSCDYDKAYDLCYILHEISYWYDIIEERSKPDESKTEMLNRKIKRLSMQLEALRRLRPSLPPIPEVADSIGDYANDSLLSRLYSIGQYSGKNLGGLDDWYVLDEEDQEVRARCVKSGRRLIKIYRLYLQKDSLLAENYKSLLNEFNKTYWESRYTFRFLQKDFFTKHDLPFLYLIANYDKIVHDYKNEVNRCGEWNKNHTNDILWIIPVELLCGLLFAFIIYHLLLILCKKNNKWKDTLCRRKRLFISAINSFLWLTFMVLNLIYLPVEFRLSSGVNILIYFLFIIAIQFSLIVLDKDSQMKWSVAMYMPIAVACLINMLLRLFFVSDAILNIVLCPTLFVILGWQFDSLRRGWNKVEKVDAMLCLGSCAVLLALFVASFFGFIYMAAGVLFWWQCMIMLFLYIYMAIVLVDRFGKTIIINRKRNYYAAIGYVDANVEKSDLIQITWLYEFIRKALIPVMIVCALPFCIYLSMDFYNAGEWFTYELMKIRTSVNIDGAKYLELSWFNITMTFSLFFVFKYIVYFVSCIYRQIKTELVRRKRGLEHMDEEMLNFSIGNNIISMFFWAFYITLICLLLHIPMKSLTFIFAGLATGVGFALKDVINNMFYGMQLMAGRLQVGDYVVCDGYRGAVKSISYQTTQMLTEEGAMVNFGNADLFSKNFQNLTRHNPYELSRVTFYVLYDADLKKVERIAKEATKELNSIDKLGRPLLSPINDVVVEFREMGTLSLEMAVKFGVLAEKRTAFLPVVRKAVFLKLDKENLLYTNVSVKDIYKKMIDNIDI